MKKKVFTVVDYFISKNNKEKIGLTNKKLQKLLYYAQAWNLVFFNKKMFDEDIEAWVHGPAIPIVYSKYKDFGFNNIEAKVDEKDFSQLSDDEKKLLDDIWSVYGKYDAGYLEMLSHSEDPWIKARNQQAPYENSSNIISPDLMKQYYGRQISK